MTVVGEPVTTGLPANGGNTPVCPFPFAWWQLEQFVLKTLAPFPAAAIAPGDAALLIAPAVAAALATGDAPGEALVVVVVVVVEELLLFPPEQPAAKISNAAAVKRTGTVFCIPSFLSQSPAMPRWYSMNPYGPLRVIYPREQLVPRRSTFVPKAQPTIRPNQ